MTNKFISRLLAYFGRGLLAIAPLGLTIYVIYGVFIWVDGLVPINIPGIGFLIMTGIILGSGLLISTVIPQSFASLFEGSIRHLPLVGDKKKFNQPVLVMLNRESGVRKIGFITQTNLSQIGLSDVVMVYCPHSYAFSGELYIVPSENVKLLSLSSSEAMKLIVSGGVSN